MEGRKTIPILDPEVEARSRGSGPVITYQLSPEELEKYRNEKPPQTNVKFKPPIVFETDRRRMKEETDMSKGKEPSKVEFLRLVAGGNSINKAAKSMGLNSGPLYYWLDKWGLKGIKPDRAKQLVDEMAIDGVDTQAKFIPPLPASEEQVNVFKQQKEEIAQLKEALEGAAFIATQSGERIRELEKALENARHESSETITQLSQERDGYKRAAEDLEDEPSVGPDLIRKPETDAEVKQLVKVIENNDRDVAQIRPSRTITLRTAGSQGEVEDELTAMLAYVQAMRGRSFKLELFLGEVEGL